MTPTRGSVRNAIRVARHPDEVWAVVGDPVRLPEWFPGVRACTVDGDRRVVTTEAGIDMPEHLLTVDRLQRRFQYRITAPLVREHLSTVDVIDLDDGTSLVVYGVDAEPAVLALVIGGAAGDALEQLRLLVEEGTG